MPELGNVKLVVSIGEPGRTFKAGDFINAVDELYWDMQEHSGLNNESAANILEIYAKWLREEG